MFGIVGVEGPSTSVAETLIETSNSSLSPEPESVSSRISTSLREFDSLEVDRDDQGIINRILSLHQFLLRNKKKFRGIFVFAKIKQKMLHIASNTVTESFYLP